MKDLCYIVSAGDVGGILPRISEHDLVIAADAGYLALGRLGLTADIAVGDFDSLGSVPECKEIIKHPVRKDDTDTMLAVKTGYDRGYRSFVLLGCTGGARPDHTIANIQTLLWLAERGARGYMYGEPVSYTAICNGCVRFPSGGRGTVSVFCFGRDARGVCEKGLEYSLEDAVLTSSFPLGVSNSFTDGRAEISVRDGSLVICWQTSAGDFMNTVREG